MKAVAYLRVSGKNQINGSGFDRQEEVIRRYCKKKKVTLEQIYREQVSGTKFEENRPVFKAMVAEILSSNGDKGKDEIKGTIFIEALDRLARKYSVQDQLLTDLVRNKIDLISVDTEEIITESFNNSPAKQFQNGIKGLLAQYEFATIVNRLAKGRRDRRDVKGLKYPCPPPFGEKPEEREILKYIVHARHNINYRKGTKKPSMTFQQIADHLNAEGHPPKQAKTGQWTAGTVYHVYRRAKELGLR